MSFGTCCGHGLLRKGVWIWRSSFHIHTANVWILRLVIYQLLRPQGKASKRVLGVLTRIHFTCGWLLMWKWFSQLLLNFVPLWYITLTHHVMPCGSPLIFKAGCGYYTVLLSRPMFTVALQCSSMHVNLSSHTLMYINNVSFDSSCSTSRCNIWSTKDQKFCPYQVIQVTWFSSVFLCSLCSRTVSISDGKIMLYVLLTLMKFFRLDVKSLVLRVVLKHWRES